MDSTYWSRVYAVFVQSVHIGSQSVSLPVAVSGFILLIPFLRLLLIHALFRPLGLRFLPPSKENGATKDDKIMSALEKWEMASWTFVTYLTSTVYGIYAIGGEPWFSKVARVFYDCERLPCEWKAPNKLILMYCLQLGYYIQAIPALYVWDLKRKDFNQMAAHHCATILLIVYSLGLNLTKIGGIILLTHDVCDVFMEAAKLMKYLGHTDLATATFGLFVLVWISTRVIYFPLMVIRSCLVDTIGFLSIPYDIPPEPHYTMINGLLITLFCIHLYWTYLILKIIWSVLVLKEEVDDIREDEDDDTKKQK